MPILPPLPDRPPAQSPSQPDDYTEPMRGDYSTDSRYAQAYEHMRPQMMNFIDIRDRGRHHYTSSQLHIPWSRVLSTHRASLFTDPDYIPATGTVGMKIYEDNGNPTYVPPEGIVPITLYDEHGVPYYRIGHNNPTYIQPEGTVPITNYYGNGIRADSNVQSAQPRPTYIPADIPLESQSRRQDDSETLYNELDEDQMMDVDRGEESSQL